MRKLNKVIKLVKAYYSKKNPAINWNEWVFEKHNKVVAGWVEDIAKHHHFNKDAVLAAAYLHDLAYAWTSKNDPKLDEKSESEAHQVLTKAGYSQTERSFIVDKIIHGHGMYNKKVPKTIEAKVLATADALAHFTTDFYLVMCWNHYLFEDKKLDSYKTWVLKKIERDYYNKIFFTKYKKIAKPYRESLKRLFSL